MKQYFHAFCMCQSMFCALPAPQVWDEEARGKMLLFLPLVGLEMGLGWAGMSWLCQFLALPRLISALVLALYPYLVTGYLHLDGFMDVTDAVRSWRDLDRRREILKDSHVGSFAVISLALVCLAQFACAASLPQGKHTMLILIPAVSRCCSALAVTVLKPMATSQYAATTRPRGHVPVLLGLLALFLTLGFLLGRWDGLALIGCLVGYALALGRGYRSLEGMNGDIAGYALTIGELCALAVYALV